MRILFRIHNTAVIMLMMCDLNGIVPRDFRLQVFFINQFPPSPGVSHWGRFEFSKKFEMTYLILFSGTWGKVIHEKKLKQKISWHCPLKVILNFVIRRPRDVWPLRVPGHQQLRRGQTNHPGGWTCRPRPLHAHRGGGGAARPHPLLVCPLPRSRYRISARVPGRGDRLAVRYRPAGPTDDRRTGRNTGGLVQRPPAAGAANGRNCLSGAR